MTEEYYYVRMNISYNFFSYLLFVLFQFTRRFEIHDFILCDFYLQSSSSTWKSIDSQRFVSFTPLYICSRNMKLITQMNLYTLLRKLLYFYLLDTYKIYILLIPEADEFEIHNYK